MPKDAAPTASSERNAMNWAQGKTAVGGRTLTSARATTAKTGLHRRSC